MVHLTSGSGEKDGRVQITQSNGSQLTLDSCLARPQPAIVRTPGQAAQVIRRLGQSGVAHAETAQE